MALYKFPESSLLAIISHVPQYGLSVSNMTSEIINNGIVYTIELTGDIPGEELPHLISGYELEIL